MHKRFTPSRSRGLTLLEFIIALSLVILVIGVAVSQMNSQQHKAEQVIAQLQLARTGMLRFNRDFPCSTTGLSALVKREDAVQGGCGASNDSALWNGPYIDGSSPLSDKNLNISSVYADSTLELRQEMVGNTFYQAIVLSGSAVTNLRSSIMEQCGTDCLPFPGRDDIGILVSQVNFANSTPPTTNLAFIGVPSTPPVYNPLTTTPYTLPPSLTPPGNPVPPTTTIPPTTPPGTPPTGTPPPIGTPPTPVTPTPTPTPPTPQPPLPEGPTGPPAECQTTHGMSVSNYIIMTGRNSRTQAVSPDATLLTGNMCGMRPLVQTDPPDAKIQACLDAGNFNAVHDNSTGTCTNVVQDVPWDWTPPASQLVPWTRTELRAFCQSNNAQWACANI